ncbi:SusC/RagA family TonB-linked outer membrane protein [Bacteroidia bacterium]|nr:SusC/RagA family TonB-linked outer membrane protein [Bacteroidia bacterium]
MLICVLVQARAESYAQNTRISVDKKNASVEDILNIIEEKSEFYFLYNNKLVDVERKVNVHVENSPIYTVLNEVFDGTDITYKVENRQIILSPRSIEQQQTDKRISGTVTDMNGDPIIGAKVVEKGKATNGAITDIDGNFSLTLANNAILQIFYIGYVTKEVTVGNQTNLHITIEEDVQSLEEVLVVGYGTQKKLAITGSVASVTGQSVQKSSSVDLSSSLAGRMSGVIVNNRSGEPGAEATTILIRGRSTLNNNEPLIVIDGIPGRESLTYLNPNDIENITVLKDASAAIYGQRSANGVILVTTKRGKKGDKPKITFSYDLGVQQPTRLMDMADAPTFAQLYNESNAKKGGGPQYREDEIEKYRNGSDLVLYPNTDWFNVVIKPVSLQHKYNLDFSGGTNSVAYFVSVGGTTQDGIYKNSATKYSQMNLRSNIDVNVTETFKIGVDVSARIQNNGYSPLASGDYGLFYRVRDMRPTIPVYYPDGRLAGGSNPIALVSDLSGYDKRRHQRLNTTLTANWDLSRFLKGLSLNGNVAYDNTSVFRKMFEKPFTYYSYDSGSDTYEKRKSTNVPTPQLTERYTPAWALTLNAMINYDRTFAEKHHVGMMLGMERSNSRTDILEARRLKYSQDILDELFAGDKDKTYYDNYGEAAETARLGYFGRLTYDYEGIYYLQFLLRRDGSENFPNDERWGWFPGISFGWRLSEYSFIKNVIPSADNLKIRASYGEQGNDRIDPFQYLSLYDYGRTQVFINESGSATATSGIYPSVFPNPDVTWEVAKTYNLALEGSFKKGLFGFEAEVFKTHRSNILITRNASVPVVTGLTNLPDENIGIVENKGFELQLNHSGKHNDFTYNISGNFLFARNKIIYMDETPWGEGHEYLAAEGHPMGSRLLYKVTGLNKDKSYLTDYPQAPGAVPGDFIFEDIDGDGKITTYDRYRADLTTIPEIVFGATFEARWKGFDFMMLFQGQGRARYYMTPRIDPVEGNIMQNIADGRWSSENPAANKPGVGGTINNAGVWPSDYWYRDASFLRLKNIELGYALPYEWLNNSYTKINNLRFYIGAYNLFTIDRLKVVDPENNDSNGASYPQLRIFNAGIKLTF